SFPTRRSSDMGWSRVTMELPALATAVELAAGWPPRTGWPDRPGAGVPVAPMGGSVFCCTVELCTGCNCWGAPTTLRLAVLVRLLGEQAATRRATAARLTTDEAPRFQSCIDHSCRKGLRNV